MNEITYRKDYSLQPNVVEKIANRKEGLILKSKEEIQQYFDEWAAKSRSTQLNKLQKLKERADKLDIRVRELVAKKEKYQAIEEEGKKLPATWKSIARSESDVSTG